MSYVSFPGGVPAAFASQEEALSCFDGLPAVRPVTLIGLWKGRGIPSGHWLDGVLENLGWFGKRFHADLRADALLFHSGRNRLSALDPARVPIRLALRFHSFGRTRMARNCFSYLQRGLRARGTVASLQLLSFRGRESAAMVYDRQPIVDHFRAISDDRILGLMAIEGDGRHFTFMLERVEPGAPERR